MAKFTGTNANEAINPLSVSPTVTVQPPASGFGGDDLIIASGGNDDVFAGDGEDDVRGGAGDDTLDGGGVDGAADLITGGTGDDTIAVHAGDDADGEGDDDLLLLFGAAGTVIDGGTGFDRLDASEVTSLAGASVANVEELFVRGQGNLTLSVAQLASFDRLQHANNFQGDSYSFFLTGGGTASIEIGNQGIDTFLAFFGSSAADTLSLISSEFTDLLEVVGGGGNDTLTTGITQDFLDGGNGGDILNSGSGGDDLTGGSGNDTLNGGDGDDHLDGGAGKDRLNGGAGFDFASYASATSGVSVSLLLTGFQDTVGAGSDRLTGIEGLEGSDFDDLLRANDAGNSLSGGEGDDDLIGRNGDDSLRGGDGDDSVNAALGDDVLEGGDGNDGILGGGDDDSLKGGDGDDSLDGGTGNDDIEGGSGNDRLSGGFQINFLNGGAGIDLADYSFAFEIGVSVDLQIVGIQNTVTGLDFDTLVSIESVAGARGSDQLTGNAVANSLFGDRGDDILTGNDGNDVLIGNENDDELRGGRDSDILNGGLGDDLIDGGTGASGGGLVADTASYASFFGSVSGVTVSLAIAGAQDTGGAGTDTLVSIENLEGGDEDDTLTGNGFANRLAGGEGDDVLQGNGGADTFAFTRFGGTDTINDWTNGVDKLAFSGFGSSFDTAAEIRATAVQLFGSVVIVVPNGDGTDTLVGLTSTSLAELDNSDFIVTG